MQEYILWGKCRVFNSRTGFADNNCDLKKKKNLWRSEGMT